MVSSLNTTNKTTVLILEKHSLRSSWVASATIGDTWSAIRAASHISDCPLLMPKGSFSPLVGKLTATVGRMAPSSSASPSRSSSGAIWGWATKRVSLMNLMISRVASGETLSIDIDTFFSVGATVLRGTWTIFTINKLGFEQNQYNPFISWPLRASKNELATNSSGLPFSFALWERLWGLRGPERFVCSLRSTPSLSTTKKLDRRSSPTEARSDLESCKTWKNIKTAIFKCLHIGD